MKKNIALILLFSLFVLNAQAQVVGENDTLYLNYFIAAGEFGGVNEGLMIYTVESEIKAKSIRFTKSTYGMPLEKDTIIGFYKRNKNNYTLKKGEWVLSEEQYDFIVKVSDEIRTRTTEKNVFSNASEHYVILSQCEECVFFDRAGNWNKFIEIKQVLNID